MSVSPRHRARFRIPFQRSSFLSPYGSTVFNTWPPRLLPKREQYVESCWEAIMVQTWLPSLPPESTAHHLFTRLCLTAGVPEVSSRLDVCPGGNMGKIGPRLGPSSLGLFHLHFQLFLPIIMLFLFYKPHFTLHWGKRVIGRCVPLLPGLCTYYCFCFE